MVVMHDDVVTLNVDLNRVICYGGRGQAPLDIVIEAGYKKFFRMIGR